MANDVSVLKAKLEWLEKELASVRAKLEKLETGEVQSPRPFAKLWGIAKGPDLTYEEIKAHEYTLKDKDWE